jgi:hypothetical protein
MTTWDANYEASPADGDEIKYGANKIRELKVAARERLEVEHSMTTGRHNPGECTVMGLGNATDIANLANAANGAIAHDSNTGEMKRYEAGWQVIRKGQANLSLDIIAAAWPVGSIFISTVSTDPANLLGVGTWAAYGAGKVLVGIDANDSDFDTANKTGGNKTHALAIDELPAHTHDYDKPTLYGTGSGIAKQVCDYEFEATASNSTGSGNAHNNVQPYIVVYMWLRTA